MPERLTVCKPGLHGLWYCHYPIQVYMLCLKVCAFIGKYTVFLTVCIYLIFLTVFVPSVPGLTVCVPDLHDLIIVCPPV